MLNFNTLEIFLTFKSYFSHYFYHFSLKLYSHLQKMLQSSSIINIQFFLKNQFVYSIYICMLYIVLRKLRFFYIILILTMHSKIYLLLCANIKFIRE